MGRGRNDGVSRRDGVRVCVCVQCRMHQSRVESLSSSTGEVSGGGIVVVEPKECRRGWVGYR